MKLMVIGGGGREHAIIKKLKENPAVEKIYCLPGNGGIAADAVCVSEIGAKDIPAQVEFAKAHGIDYAVVAPDDPLALGAVDALSAAGIPCFGPDKKAAVIEASKAFAKDLMQKYNIPTAKYRVFTDAPSACAYIDAEGAPIVVKADGLALGKGVVVAQTVEEAKAAVRSMIEDKAFGQLGDILGSTLLDSRETLSAVDDPYYHTDHHWTTMGAQAAYTLWAQATGHTARSYELTLATDSFRGTLYSKVLLPDSVYDSVYYAPEITVESVVCDGKDGALYDLSALEQKDKYELFLGGNYGQCVITTGTENGKHLLLVKDSFANSFVPFLTGDYETITMIDLRYYRGSMAELAAEVDDILVLTEVTNLAGSGDYFKLSK